jgi:NADH-quinone oxidoreductase subunit C
MTTTCDSLKAHLSTIFGDALHGITDAEGQFVLTVLTTDYLGTLRTLRDHPALDFAQLLDLCGVDYSDYGNGAYEGARFAVVLQLLSITHNWRLRVKVFAPDDDMPVLPSVIDLWNSADWYEREAFDLFGIVFEGHPDLRRILTDYGFIGHPFRKDFPISGYVEVRFDPDQKRVIYQPVTIPPREITPRVIREKGYGRN